MVGSAIRRALREEGHRHVLTPSRRELDLLRQADVERFVETHAPDIVIIAAARVGGIHANRSFPADFLYENLAIAANLIHASFRAKIGRLLFLGSSCIYPKLAPQPMPEDCLLTGPLEPTNEAYAIAKIAGLKLCQAYRRQHGVLFHSAMPTNLYGPGDNYHPEHSHVIPALIRRFHEAKEEGRDRVLIWGTGRPRREFLHVDDLARACLHLLRMPAPPDWVNVGVGADLSIGELAREIASVVGYEAEIAFDPSMPDGTPRKLLDCSQIFASGWKPEIGLREGLEGAYVSFLHESAGAVLRES